MWFKRKKEMEEPRLLPEINDSERHPIRDHPALKNPMEGNPQDLRPESIGEMSSDNIAKDLQVIMSKLDLINARLENLHQRLSSIERVAYEEQKKAW